MFHAVFLITTGALLLANNFGYLPWTIWKDIIPYWPALIIFAGIDVIFGKTVFGKLVSGVINSIIFLLIITKAIGYNLPILNRLPTPRRNPGVQRYFFTQENSKSNFN
jgi:hypothetical protein